MKRQENIIYLVVWGLLFASPLLSLYIRTISDSGVTFDWTEIFIVWRKFAVYLVLFLVHNFLIAPLLVQRHRRLAYFSIVAVVIATFTVYQCSSRPTLPNDPPKAMNQKALNTTSMGRGKRFSSTMRRMTCSISLSRISGMSL